MARKLKIPLELELVKVEPLTENQKIIFDAFADNKHCLMTGCAGTGKTFIAFYLALKEYAAQTNNKFHSIKIFRSVVPVRDVGFLPGTYEEKVNIYKDPYKDIFYELFKRPDAFDIYEEKGIIEFKTTSFLRGLTIDNSIIIIDEIQNCTYKELFSVITRMGNNTRLIACGDSIQDDLTKRETTGFHEISQILSRMDDEVECVEFDIDDIVRGNFVKKFIKVARGLGLA